MDRSRSLATPFARLLVATAAARERGVVLASLIGLVAGIGACLPPASHGRPNALRAKPEAATSSEHAGPVAESPILVVHDEAGEQHLLCDGVRVSVTEVAGGREMRVAPDPLPAVV